MYDTVAFTWWLREDKLAVIVNMLLKLEESDTHKLKFVKSITGKLVHYRLMVPDGKFHLGQLIRVSKAGPKEDLNKLVKVTDWCRSEAWFWRTMLPFCSKRIILPEPNFNLPPWTLTAHTDSAGGSVRTVGYGAGAVIGEEWWSYLPWGQAINSGQLFTDGKRLSNKLTALELVGPLMVLTAGVDLVRNKSLIIPVDNYGSVAVYNKGWCSGCMLATTLVLAISEVAAAINCQLEIVKIRRCSNDASRAADSVSKRDWNRFRSLMPRASLQPARVPGSLVRWVNSPVEDRLLGERILRDMGIQKNIFGHHSRYI